MKRPIVLYLVFLIGLVPGCKQDILSKGDFLKYVKNKDHGLLQELKKSDVLTSATYVPVQFIYTKDRNSKKNKDAIATTSSRMFFVISLSKNGKELLSQLDLNVYSNVLQTLSFQMMPLVSLRLDDEHSIAPSDCLFQQTFGLSTANELLLVFDSAEIKASKKYSLTIDDFGVGLGELKYNFSRSDIDRLNKVLKI